MSKFIELTDTDDNSVLVNVDHIFEVCKDEDDYTTVCIAANGYDDYPYLYITTNMSYEAVKSLIYAACGE